MKINFADKTPDLVLKHRRNNNLVVSPQEVLTGVNGFQDIEALDEIYIKSLLLDHPDSDSAADTAG